MKAVRVHAPGGPEAMKFEEVPEPTPKAGEAVVKVDAAGLNYIDVYQRSGLYKLDMPLTLGLEAGGTVTAVGPGVTDVKVDDKVAYTGVPGAYAQYAAVPAARLVVLPQGVSTRQGAAAMLQGMTAHYLARSIVPLAEGDTAVVHAGAGGVGLLLTQVLRDLGIRVFTTVSTADKADLSRAAGAEHVFSYDDFVAGVRAATDGVGAHIVFDGVSIYRVLVPELAVAYAALSLEETPQLPPPSLQYGDYAVWQRGRLHGSEEARCLEYWRRQLADLPPDLKLPVDRLPAEPRRHEGGMLTFDLPHDLTARLKNNGNGRFALRISALLPRPGIHRPLSARGRCRIFRCNGRDAGGWGIGARRRRRGSAQDAADDARARGRAFRKRGDDGNQKSGGGRAGQG